MKRQNAFAQMLLHHLEALPNEQLVDEIDSLALNIGGIICDAPIRLSHKQQDQILDAVCLGMKEIVREYRPKMHLIAKPACKGDASPPA